MKKLAFLGAMLLAFAIGRPAHAGGTWAGFYVGANAGYAWGSANSTLSIADGQPATNCHFCADFGAGPTGNDAGVAQNAGSPSFNFNGFTGGGQAGYNWQNNNWVYGLEVDFDSFAQSQTTNNSIGLPANSPTPVPTAACLSPLPVQCVGNFSTSVKADWLLTLRPRIGYAWNQTLAYVTGGLALSRLSFSQSYSDNINFAGGNPGGSESASVSQTKVGWVIGGGLEQAIGNSWSMKAEYLYVRFDNLSAGGTLRDSYPNDYANFANNVNYSSNILRVGVNYRFGGSP